MPWGMALLSEEGRRSESQLLRYIAVSREKEELGGTNR